MMRFISGTKVVLTAMLVLALLMSCVGAFAQENNVESDFRLVKEGTDIGTQETQQQTTTTWGGKGKGGKVNEGKSESTETAPQAIVQIKLYTVTFLNAKGKVFARELVEEGQPIYMTKKVPKLKGQTFSHWYNEKQKGEDKTKYFMFGQPAQADLVLKPFFISNKLAKASKEQLLKTVIVVEEEGAEQSEAQVTGQEQRVAAPKVIEEKAADLEIVEEELEECLDTVEVVEETVIQVTETPAELDARTAMIKANIGTQVTVGEVITLIASVNGYEGLDYEVVWQYDDGSGWQVAQRGGQTMSFTLNEENYHWQWRLEIVVQTAENV